MTMPLDGIKILDLSRLAPGPYCTMLLGDMGADVLLIEEAGTPSGRRAAQAAGADDPNAARRAAANNSLGRNKRSIRLNLKSDEAREVLQAGGRGGRCAGRLSPWRGEEAGRRLRDAERVQSAHRLLLAQRLRPRRPLLAARRTRHQLHQHRRGAGHDRRHGKGGKPAIPVNIIADYAGGGLMAAFAILCALQARERTGRGQNVDIAMSDRVLSLIASMAGTHFATGVGDRAWGVPAQRAGAALQRVRVRGRALVQRGCAGAVVLREPLHGDGVGRFHRASVDGGRG